MKSREWMTTRTIRLGETLATAGRLLCLLALSVAVLPPSALAQTVLTTVSVGAAPRAVAYNATIDNIYVANGGSNTVTIINGATNQSFPVIVGQAPVALAVNSVTGKTYVACFGSGVVSIIDAAHNDQVSTVPVGLAPFALAVNPLTNKIYVANEGSNNVTVIDGATNQTSLVTVDQFPVSVGVNPLTNKIYVANSQSNSVTVIDGATNQTSSVAVGVAPVELVVNPLTNQIYVANGQSSSVTVIDGATNQTTTVQVGATPVSVALNQVTNEIYVANRDSSTVSIFDGATLNTHAVTVGNKPLAVSVNPVTNKIYVANSGDNTITTIDGATNNVNTLSVGRNPTNLTADQSNNRVYVANTDDNTVSVIAGAIANPLYFAAVAPCRLVDTRLASGGSGPIQGGTFQTFPIPTEGGCNIPSQAAAYSLNLTVVPLGALGYLTVWPTGEAQPFVSTLNSYDGRVKGNATIVPAGYQGAISIYVSDTTDVVLDIDGYFSPGSAPLAFHPLPPCRVADTRNPPGDLGGPYLTGRVPRDFPILEAAQCNIPSSAQAYSLNLTAVPRGSLGFLRVWATGQNQPNVSTLNSYGGQAVANAAIVPAGTGGDVTALASDNSDLVIDINGYFAPSEESGGLALYPVSPCRTLDTRAVGNGQPFQGKLPVDVTNSACALPSQSQAYVFNATVVPSNSLGFLSLWPYDITQPWVSTLNSYDGAVTSNMAIVPAGSQGKIDAYASDLTQLLLDISAYFAP